MVSLFLLLLLYILPNVYSYDMLNEEEYLLNEYTFYYESYRYLINWDNYTINIMDHILNNKTNNIFIFKSYILNINNNIIIDYTNYNDWNEIQILDNTNNNNNNNNNKKRRRLEEKKKGKKKKKKRRRRKRKRRKHKKKLPPHKIRDRWHHKHNQYSARGRFVGFYYGKKNGVTFVGAHNYCKRRYGGLASILNGRDNKEVWRVCNEALGPHKKRPHFCWIGLKYPFKKWEDNRPLEYKYIDMSQENINEKGQYVGNYKCIAMGKKTSRWYYKKCQSKHTRYGAVCQRPRGIYVGNYIIIQKEYSYDDAQDVCKKWYGTSLATIKNIKTNKKVRNLCQKVSKNAHCWIGLQAPFTLWNDDNKVTFTSWAKGEPNDHRGVEECTEIYPSGKWNDIPCRSHRYPVCNSRIPMERLSKKQNKALRRKVYSRFRMIWAQNYANVLARKAREKAKANQYIDKSLQHGVQKEFKYRLRDNMRSIFFNKQYDLKGKNKLPMMRLYTPKMKRIMYYTRHGELPPMPKYKQKPYFTKNELKGLDKLFWAKKRHKMYGYNPFLSLQKLRMLRNYYLNLMRQRSIANQFNRAGFMNSYNNLMGAIGYYSGAQHMYKHVYGDLDSDHYIPGYSPEPSHKYDRIPDINEPIVNDGSKRYTIIKHPKTKETIMKVEIPKIQLINRKRRLLMIDLNRNDSYNNEVLSEHKKCILLSNNNEIIELCVSNNYIDIKKYIKHDNDYDDNDDVLHNSISNCSDYNIDYLHYQYWKYKTNIYINNNKHEYDSDKLRIIEDPADLIHFAKRFQLLYIFSNNDKNTISKQCQSFMGLFQLCLLLTNGNNVLFNIMDDDKDSILYSFDFSNNNDWSEINTVSYMDKHVKSMEKCTYSFQMKICIESMYYFPLQKSNMFKMHLLIPHKNHNEFLL